MSLVEESLLRRNSGWKIVAVSVAIGGAGILPLLLYIAFGPEDGNPIGLGLLAMLAVPVAGIGIVIGLITALVQHFGRRGR